MVQELLTKIDFISPIFYQILYMTVVGSIVGLIIYFIRNIFDNKISGKWKCIMWCIALVALLVPIRFEIKIDKAPKIQNEIINKVEDIKYIGNSEFMTTESFEKIAPAEIPENNSEIVKNNTELISKNENINEANLITNTKVSIPLKTIVINIVIPYIWLLGTAIFILTFLGGIVKINKRISRNVYKDERLENILKECKIQLNIKKKVKIILQKYKKVPSIFGIFNPSILITEKTLQEDNETIKYIFLHELAHYKRKDIIFNFVLLCVLSIHWFNPIVWFLFNKVRQDIEIGADELASKKLNKNEKKEYGMVLINLLRNKQEEAYTANMLCMSDTGKNMERRILMIKGKRKSIILSFLIVTVVVGILAVFAFVKVIEKENINNDNLGLSSNIDDKTEELTEEERIAVEEYVNKICNDCKNKICEFEDINEADKSWIYSHLHPGTPAYINDEPYIYEFGYSTEKEAEDYLKDLFGESLILDIKSDIDYDVINATPYGYLFYDKEAEEIEFLPIGFDVENNYIIDSTKKIGNQYITKVIEYFESRDMDRNADLNSAVYAYDDKFEDGSKKIFISDNKTDEEIIKEVLERKNEFSSYNIITTYDLNNKLYVQQIKKSQINFIKQSDEKIVSAKSNNIASSLPVGNLNLEITRGSYFSDGFACVSIKSEESSVYIDKLGNILRIPNNTGNKISSGLTPTHIYGYSSSGYSNKNGVEAIKHIYEIAFPFEDDLALVRKDGKWGFIDTSGNIVIDFFDSGDRMPSQFSDDLCWLYDENNKFGCIDKQGNLVIDYKYDFGGQFTEGLACVRKGQKYGYIDKNENVIIPLIYDNEGYPFSDGLALIYDNGKYKYLDKQGNIALVSPYEKAGSFTEGLAWSYKDGKYGFIDKQGNVVIDFQYDSIDCFSEGLALVEKNGQFGYIDYNGKVIIGKLD